MRWLYRYQADGVLRYVLATSGLREIAGASNLIEQIGEALESIASKEIEVLVQAAGWGLLRFQDEDVLRQFAAWWPLLLARMAPGMRFTTAWVRDEPQSGRAALSRLRDQLVAALPTATLPESTPLVRPFAQTGGAGVPLLEDAYVQRYPDEARADTPTRAKRWASWRAQTRGDADPGEQPVDRLHDLLAGEGEPAFALEVDQFAQPYVAVIHIDGNGVGQVVRRLEDLGDAARLGRFSEALRQATRSAAVAAVNAVRAETPTGQTLPLRPILLGGDDLAVIVKAELGLEFTRRYLEAFEAHTRDSELIRAETSERGLSAAAGLAYVKVSWPISDALTLATALTRAAKSALRGADTDALGERTPSGLLLHRVTTALTDDWEELLRGELASHADARGPWEGAFSFGPYTLRSVPGFATIDDLERLRNQIAPLPTGALREWLHAAKQNRAAADRAWTRLAEVVGVRAERDWEAFTRTLADMNVQIDPSEADEGLHLGWRLADPERPSQSPRTPIADALALRAAENAQHQPRRTP